MHGTSPMMFKVRCCLVAHRWCIHVVPNWAILDSCFYISNMFWTFHMNSECRLSYRRNVKGFTAQPTLRAMRVQRVRRNPFLISVCSHDLWKLHLPGIVENSRQVSSQPWNTFHSSITVRLQSKAVNNGTKRIELCQYNVARHSAEAAKPSHM